MPYFHYWKIPQIMNMYNLVQNLVYTHLSGVLKFINMI